MSENETSIEDSLPMQLRHVYLTMHRVAQAHFSSYSATADQFVLLSLLQEEDGITQTELGQKMATDANTVTAMLKVLENRDWIQRERCKQDGRARRVYLKSKGKKLAEKMLSGSEILREAIEEAIPVGQREQFQACLLNIIQTVQQYEEKQH
ncbi:Bacterial regulatory protein, MarR [Planctomycetales bacterium 10988]|nr:Bacterial regulatory protein, MarR [Planctomycetales bacterium 10988]